LGSVAIGSINLLASVTAVSVVDRIGRKPMLLGGVLVQAVALTVIAVIFALDHMSQTAAWALVIAFAIYFAAFAASFATSCWVYFAEVGRTTATRLQASATFVAVNMIMNFIVALSILPVRDALGAPVLFGTFAAVCALAAAPFVAWVVPETAKQALETIVDNST
jgi:major inositol transporter-like SP family MFS transporter